MANPRQYTADNILVTPSSSPDDPGLILSVTPDSAGWDYISFQARRLDTGQSWSFQTGDAELAIVNLTGTYTVDSSRGSWPHIGGRSSVFDAAAHALYLPRHTDFTIAAEQGGEFAVTWVPTDQDHEPWLIRPQDVEVSVRGGDNVSRQINDLLPPGSPVHRLVLVEVYTPSGNWSSYPGHKHDVHIEDASGNLIEADLEEVYFYKTDRPEGYAYQRVYTDGRSPLHQAGYPIDALVRRTRQLCSPGAGRLSSRRLRAGLHHLLPQRAGRQRPVPRQPGRSTVHLGEGDVHGHGPAPAPVLERAQSNNGPEANIMSAGEAHLRLPAHGPIVHRPVQQRCRRALRADHQFRRLCRRIADQHQRGRAAIGPEAPRCSPAWARTRSAISSCTFLNQEGVDTRFSPRKPGHRTSAVVLGIEPPDKFPLVYYRDNCADIELTIDDVLAAPVADSKVLQFAGTNLSKEPSRSATMFAAETARQVGTDVVFDIDFRPDQWHDPRAFGVVARSVLPLVDIVIGTEDEINALMLTDPAQMELTHSQISDTQGRPATSAAAVAFILRTGPQGRRREGRRTGRARSSGERRDHRRARAIP